MTDRIKSRLVGLLALAMLVPLTTSAGEYRIECPPILEAESLQFAKVPSGWTSFIPSFIRLHSASAMDGPPSLMAVLIANSHKKRGNRSISTWHWDVRDKTSYPDGKWMACNYGEGNYFILAKQLDANTEECTVTHTKYKIEPTRVDIVCKR